MKKWIKRSSKGMLAGVILTATLSFQALADTAPFHANSATLGTYSLAMTSAIGTRYTTAKNLNFRSKPSSTSSVIGTIPYGSKVSLLKTHSSGWVQISYNGKTGYVASKFLVTTAPTKTVYRYTTAKALNFRTKPSTTGYILAKIPYGTKLVYLGAASSNWSKVRYQGTTGYVSSKLLSLKDPSTNAPSQPLIGIAWEGKDMNHSASYRRIKAAIKLAGGVPKDLPQTKNSLEAKSALAKVDGVIFPGGGDFSTGYKTVPNYDLLKNVDLVREKSEFNLMDAAIQLNKPTLGICRGMQVLNIQSNGSLYQDIYKERRDELGVYTQQHKSSSGGVIRHRVNLSYGSKIRRIFGVSSLTGHSIHHQAIRTLGKNLIVEARANDKIIEAVRRTDKKFMLGIQFHAERSIEKGDKVSLNLKLFKALVSAAK